jgi:isopenicillin N synthase-like dioxygenase
MNVSRRIPTVDFADMLGDERQQERFVQAVGDSLKDIGFFALKNHGIDLDLIERSYEQSDVFFSLPKTIKQRYLQPEISHQRGYTAFGVEHAKDNDAPDLKEFWQNGRTHTGKGPQPTYPANVWPEDHAPGFKPVIDGLFEQMEALAQRILKACSIYLDKPADWLNEMSQEGNTIMRIIHYPPVGKDAPVGAVRSAAHEDINLITLLVTATADGLQVMDHDGSWIKVEGDARHIIVDSGDMLQNITNGLFRSTTHRVVNPKDTTARRFSMPMFVHPRNEIDLTPRNEFVEQTGGTPLYSSITAGAYLHQRLVEIGLAEPEGDA